MMTRRLPALLLFLVLAGLLAPAGFAKAATTSYYAVNCSSGYVMATLNGASIDELTWVVVMKVYNPPNELSNWTQYATIGFTSDTGWKSWLAIDFYSTAGASYYYWAAHILNNTYIRDAGKVPQSNTYHMFVWEMSKSSGFRKSYFDGKLVVNAPGWEGGNGTGTLTMSLNGRGETAAAVLLYNRALSDSEIQQIYQDPLHPPTTGLVLEYLPSSVDPSTNTWVDESGNGNNGNIVGATYVPLRPIEESEPSAGSPYELGFDGVGDYISTNNILTSKPFSIIAIAKLDTVKNSDIIETRNDPYASGGSGVAIEAYNSNGKFRVGVGNGSAFVWSGYIIDLSDLSTHLIAVTTSSTTMNLYRDMSLIQTVDVSTVGDSLGGSTVLKIADGLAGNFPGKIYLVLIYSRALSDSEIQQIYENPSNPPLDGLVLWYSPYTYDPASGKWLNRAPIFPTIPLAEELDGVNYGATAERVSIPSAGYYDIENNSKIPVENVSVSLIENNTTTSLIPSFLTLPYNETVTLNVSATGYESRTLSILTTINSLAVYLEPLTPTASTETVIPSTTPQGPAVPQPEEDYGIWGVKPGVQFIAGNWSRAFSDFWHLNNMYALVMPLLFTIGLIGTAWTVTRSPLIILGVTAVTTTFFGMIGVPLQLAVISPLAAFFLFVLAWIGWDFYKRFERS